MSDRTFHRAAIVSAVLVFAVAAPGWAQTGGSLIGAHRAMPGEHRDAARRPPQTDAPKPTAEPLQRLDAGALVCPTEAALQQHQAALQARVSGGEVSEPSGCRFVRDRTAVAVLDRHGPSRTEVRLPGPPVQVGWTDSMVRNP